MNLDDGPRFIWLDASGQRCSPRHTTMKAALNFKKNWISDSNGTRWIYEDGERKQVSLNSSSAPSSDEPVSLKIAEWIVRELTPEDKAKVDQVVALMDEGYV